MLRRSNVGSLRLSIIGRNNMIIRSGAIWAGCKPARTICRAPAVAFASRRQGHGYTLLGGRTFTGFARNYSTESAAVNVDSRDVTADSPSSEESGGINTLLQEQAEEDDVPEDTVAEPSFKETDGASKPQRKMSPISEVAKAGTSARSRDSDVLRTVSKKAIEMELKWLKDPRALSDRVGKILAAGDIAMAAELVREAQKAGMECTAGWNHLMEYAFEKQEPQAAFKFYNDMKKRHRKPNSRTYTIMLDGLSNSPDVKHFNILTTALKIYESISSPQSSVTPNIIHANAMLKVCRRVGSLKATWQVAGGLPEEGPGAPNVQTYTIILDNLRQVTRKHINKIPPDQVEQILETQAKCVRDARRIWADIAYLWKKGQLALDNTLVISMGSVLADGPNERDLYDVLALYNQTSGLPILANKPADGGNYIARKSQTGTPVGKPKDGDYVPFVDDASKLLEQQKEQKEQKEPEGSDGWEEEEDFEKLFEPVIPAAAEEGGEAGTNAPTTPAYIKLDNRDLSLIMQACQSATQTIGAGKAYWQHLTLEDNDHKVEPDSPSCHQYLRLLRKARSSRLTVEVLRDQMAPLGLLQDKTFHIALSCCRRDNRNVNVFKHANEILDLMDKYLVLPDARTLISYLNVVDTLTDNPQLLMSMNLDVKLNDKSKSRLDTVGQKLQLALRAIAAANLQPLATKLNAAMEQNPSKRSESKSQPRSKSRFKHSDENAVHGPLAVKALIRTRGLVDEVLKKSNKSSLSKKDRESFEELTMKLRKYSNAEVAAKFDDEESWVFPTREQSEEFEDRMLRST